MSRVDAKKVVYPYVNIELPKELAEEVGINLSKVYKYIDENKNMGSSKEYGNAYRAIRKRTNELIGRKDARVSKRQVSLLRRYDPFILDNVIPHKCVVIKIPYKLDYIFRAIFDLVDELEKQYPLPEELVCLKDKVRRECFYKTQSGLYREWYSGHEKGLRIDLYDDIFSGDAALSGRF